MRNVDSVTTNHLPRGALDAERRSGIQQNIHKQTKHPKAFNKPRYSMYVIFDYILGWFGSKQPCMYAIHGLSGKG